MMEEWYSMKDIAGNDLHVDVAKVGCIIIPNRLATDNKALVSIGPAMMSVPVDQAEKLLRYLRGEDNGDEKTDGGNSKDSQSKVSQFNRDRID